MGNRRDFRRWYFEISYKMEADRDTLGPLKTQFNYVYSRLGRAAQNMVIPFAERALQIGQYNPNGLLNYLKRVLYGPQCKPKGPEMPSPDTPGG